MPHLPSFSTGLDRVVEWLHQLRIRLVDRTMSTSSDKALGRDWAREWFHLRLNLEFPYRNCAIWWSKLWLLVEAALPPLITLHTVCMRQRVQTKLMHCKSRTRNVVLHRNYNFRVYCLLTV